MAHFHQMDGLYCSEQHWEDEAPEEQTSPLPLIELDSYCDDEELHSLLSKQDSPETLTAAMAVLRRDAAEWILKVQAFHDFAAVTAVLAVNYLDRFLLRLRDGGSPPPWLGQLAAVACLSVAAKVEETEAPLLLDLQIEGAAYVFEAKTIQKMELLVLSTLRWKMHPVTSLSFVDYVTRRLGLLDHRLWPEFPRRSENVVLLLLSDSRFPEFPPSVVAAAAMLHVIAAMEPPRLRSELETLLLDISDKDKVDSCCEFILESTRRRSRKRKYGGAWEAGSPRGVIESVCFSSDSSNDSWPEILPESHFKKTRTDNHYYYY